MYGPARHVRRPPVGVRRGVRAVRALFCSHRGDDGDAAVECALVTTLVASLAFGTAAVIGSGVDQPLKGITSVLSALAGTNG